MQEAKFGIGIRFVADDGNEIGVYKPEHFDRRCNKQPETVYFNRDRLDCKNHGVSEPFVARALPEYAEDIQTIVERYPDAEFTDY